MSRLFGSLGSRKNKHNSKDSNDFNNEIFTNPNEPKPVLQQEKVIISKTDPYYTVQPASPAQEPLHKNAAASNTYHDPTDVPTNDDTVNTHTAPNSPVSNRFPPSSNTVDGPPYDGQRRGTLNATTVPDTDKPLPPPRMFSDGLPANQQGATSLPETISNATANITSTIQHATQPEVIKGALAKPLAAVDSAFAPPELDEDEDPYARENYMTVDELRQEYEDEEVDRFLRVFSRQVHEVRMPVDLPPAGPGRTDRKNADGLLLAEAAPDSVSMSPTAADSLMFSPTTTAHMTDDEFGEEWRLNPDDPKASTYSVVTPRDPHPNAVQVAKNTAFHAYQIALANVRSAIYYYREGKWPERSPSDYIAREILVPLLPAPHRKTYHFSFGNMQQTTSRIYLTLLPLYAPLMQRMWLLATWDNPTRSAIFCGLFWILWYYNYLVAALCGRTLYEIMRRRFAPYPTSKELRERRAALERADAVAEALQFRLEGNVTSGVGFKDAWNVFRTVTKNKKKKARDMAQKGINPNPEPKWEDKSPAARGEEGEDDDIKRTALAIMEELADMHERIVNIARWRNQEATARYATIIFVAMIAMIFVPAQYLAKGTYGALGFAFWFLPNIWMAIPLEHRSRIPAPLSDVPTDAEYAMEIIGQRAARGEDVLPTKLRKQKKKRGGAVGVGSPSSASLLSDNLSGKNNGSFVDVATGNEVYPSGDYDDHGRPMSPDSSTSGSDTKKGGKLRQKAVRGWMWAEEGRRMLKGQDKTAIPGYDAGHPEHLIQTYPAQQGAVMGMLTLTPDMLLFTPAMSSKVKVKIPFNDIRSVKKAGSMGMGGLRVKYIVRDAPPGPDLGDDILAAGSVGVAHGNAVAAGDLAPAPNVVGTAIAVNGAPLEREEKFRWVGGRDEVFARLVGWGGRRWVKM